MSHRRRGIFLIIANGDYENDQALSGAEKDVAALGDTFQQYGFEIQIARNKKTVEMVQEIKRRKLIGLLSK